MQIGIQEELLQLHAQGLLEPLLADKTTGSRLIWATDAHAERGPSYRREREMEAADITGVNADVIKTRARKALEQQFARTKQHAEVFTPRHICERMLSEADASYFGGTDPFLSKEKIPFTDAKAWQSYVDARRLEITCGEAPYLTERYDVTSGEAVPLGERLGVLDRKFRVVGENTNGEEEWLNWAFRALQSTYGYEFQGDNVLLARLNLLMSFAEAYRGRFGRKPDIKSYRHAETIIVWNLWQMDGISGTIPYCKSTEEYRQFSLFDSEDESIKTEQPQCRIRDWRRDRSFTYNSLKEGGSNKMKFDFIIGNPPYQEDIDAKGDRANPIYHEFMKEAFAISSVVELITPARFLFNAGQTPKAWNEKMLADKHFKVLYYESNAANVFPTTDIKGGVAITLRDEKKDYGAIDTFTPYIELNEIVRKIKSICGNFVASIVAPRGNYRTTQKFAEDHPDAASRLGKGSGNMLVSNFFEKIPEAISEKGDKDESCYKILCRINGERTYCLIEKDYIESNDFIFGYNVATPEANATGKFGERLTEGEILRPNEGATDTFVSIGSFKTEFEARTLQRYIKTKFFRALLGVKKVTHHCPPSVWSLVPLQDFTPSSDIDWSKSIPEIDRQLYSKYGLSESEIEFIESHVKEMV